MQPAARSTKSGRDCATRTNVATLPYAPHCLTCRAFDLPIRTYYLLGGPVTAATHLRDPGEGIDWRNPDLFWPDDRRWFVATDVDFWSLYIGGHNDFIAELAEQPPDAHRARRARSPARDRGLNASDLPV